MQYLAPFPFTSPALGRIDGNGTGRRVSGLKANQGRGVCDESQINALLFSEARSIIACGSFSYFHLLPSAEVKETAAEVDRRYPMSLRKLRFLTAFLIISIPTTFAQTPPFDVRAYQNFSQHIAR